MPAEVLAFLKLPGLSIQPAGRSEAPPPPKSSRVEIHPPLPPQLRHPSPAQPPQQRSEPAAARGSASRYHCEFCPYDTSSIQKLQAHLNSHQNQMTIPNYCKPCNLKFASPSQLQTHLATHDLGRNQTCMYCEKRFKTPATLKAHVKTHFAYERRCKFCEKNFASEDHLQRHMMSVHSMTC